MNSPNPVTPGAPTNDPTLTATPHVVSVLVGVVSAFLTTKLHLDPDYAQIVAIAVGSAATTLVHWIMAKLSA